MVPRLLIDAAKCSLKVCHGVCNIQGLVFGCEDSVPEEIVHFANSSILADPAQKKQSCQKYYEAVNQIKLPMGVREKSIELAR